MPATKKDKTAKKRREPTEQVEASGRGGAGEQAEAGGQGGGAVVAAARPGAGRGRRNAPPKAASAAGRPPRVRAAEAARRIHELADVSDSLEGRRRLRRLAKLVARDSRQVRRIAFIEGLLGECLDEAAAHAPPHERWLVCEAVTWGLAWLARTRRAGGSAGGLLERLVKCALHARDAIQRRDTSPARFVLALARLFRDIEACRCFEDDASAALVEEISRLVSSDGAVVVGGEPAGSNAVVDRVERWSGAREIALAIGGPAPWDKATEARWMLAVATALRLLGGHGRLLTGAGRLPEACTRSLMQAARARKGAIGRTAAAVKKPPRTLDRKGAKRLLPRDLHAADSAQAVMRTSWQRDALRVFLDYREPTPRLEIATSDRLLVDGSWSWRVSLEGRPLDAEGPWTLSCFESDRKAAFLEITAPLGGGLQLERQVVLLVRDAVVLVADAITAATPPAGKPLRLEASIALGAGLEAGQGEETREAVVYDTTMQATALPLGLPEWAAAPASGGFTVADGGLSLWQESQGGRLYAPLWLDCAPGRVGRPLTWRQLTVADTRRNLPRHQAAAFRVQSGHEQWLLYRALDMPRNRTVLGCNLSCEFLLGRIRPDGVVARTLEIQ
jgi:hypothetical protein